VAKSNDVFVVGFCRIELFLAYCGRVLALLLWSHVTSFSDALSYLSGRFFATLTVLMLISHKKKVNHKFNDTCHSKSNFNE
jgi:predicted tellurium resistance membrane protein TerC